MTLGGSIIFCILQMRSWSSENFDTHLMLQLPKWTFSFKNSFSMNSFWINLCPKDCLQSSHHPLVWLHFLISPEEGCLTKLLADFFFFFNLQILIWGFLKQSNYHLIILPECLRERCPISESLLAWTIQFCRRRGRIMEADKSCQKKLLVMLHPCTFTFSIFRLHMLFFNTNKFYFLLSIIYKNF